MLYLTYTIGVFSSASFCLLILDYKIKFEKLLKHWEWLVSKYGYLQETNMKQLLVWVYHVDIFIELWISLNLSTRNQTVDVQNNWGSLPGGKIACLGARLPLLTFIGPYLSCFGFLFILFELKSTFKVWFYVYGHFVCIYVCVTICIPDIHWG